MDDVGLGPRGLLGGEVPFATALFALWLCQRAVLNRALQMDLLFSYGSSNAPLYLVIINGGNLGLVFIFWYGFVFFNAKLTASKSRLSLPQLRSLFSFSFLPSILSFSPLCVRALSMVVLSSG